ncbi:hypothetical protein NEE14_010975 [Parabacteroides sp. AD58]|uniref:DUF4870 domain-containing protein n=1 Tax=Parabacteroides absconsus TaxID=2951805 RepID=A0ABZ2IL95_9BACT|nr:hypothetical protein [Parabacteroides sp. AD58]MCM6902615.1 hypothetical protein [Parabacteroides sp. AD58]
MLQKYFAKWGDKMFEDDMAKIVRKHSLYAAIVMAVPLFGLGIFFFIYILWHMYFKLCEKCETTLKLSTVIVGIVINAIIAIAVNLLLMALPIIGWLGTGFIVYVQFYFSGKAYIETLRKILS